jgi:hypothetical protein
MVYRVVACLGRKFSSAHTSRLAFSHALNAIRRPSDPPYASAVNLSFDDEADAGAGKVCQGFLQKITRIP